MTAANTGRSRRSRRPKGLTAHIVLILAVVISDFPIVWTLMLATNSTEDIYQTPP